MKKVIRVFLLIFIANLILSNHLITEVKSENREDFNFVTVNEEISSVKGNLNGLVLILKSGEANFVKDGQVLALTGTNYSSVSNEIMVNQEGTAFSIENGDYLNKEDTDKLLGYIDKIKNDLNLKSEEDIYLIRDWFIVTNKDDEKYNVRYYSLENDNYVIKKEVNDIEAEDISFNEEGQIVVKRGESISLYEENGEVEVLKVPEGYKINYIDKNNYILFNENQYAIVHNYEVEETTPDDEEVTVDNKTDILMPEVLSYEPVSVLYETHVQSYGWQGVKRDGQMSGTSGEAKRLEGIKINVEGLPEGASIIYRTHVQSYGWQNWVRDGEISGTEGESKRLEGIEIKLENAPSDYHIKYRVHVQNIGWQGWKQDGEMAGTSGQSKRLEAIEIKIVKGDEITELSYSTFVTNEGWKNTVYDGNISGSDSSNKVEAIKINLKDTVNGMDIQYRTHIQGIGWGEWNTNGEISGAEASSKRLEAIEINLVNAPDDYHIMYRTNIKGNGWQGWKQDGATSGTVGLSSEIIGIEIKLVEDISTPNVNYQTHVQSYGWQDWKSNGVMSGTEGQSKRLEGIKITLDNIPEENAIMYRTHVQSYGWQDWKSNGELSGTSGESKRLEAIEIKLQQPIVGYKLYYRVHVQGIGWQQWKAEGEVAGTSGQSKRLEGIEIKLVKDKVKTIVIDPGHNYGGDDGAYSTHRGITYIERDLNMQMALKLMRELEVKGFDVRLTRNAEDRETVAMRESLKRRVYYANNLNADFFISIHHNSSVSSSANGVECYYSSATPLSGGELLPSGKEINLTERTIRPYSSNPKVIKSSQISGALVNSICSKMGRINRGSIDDDYFVVKNTYMPSVLLECGFISNSTEANKLANTSLQQTMSEIIADEINKIF